MDSTLGMAASQDFCVIAVELPNLLDPKAVVDHGQQSNKYQLLVCNSISTTVDCECEIIK